VNRNAARRYLYHLSGDDDETIVNPSKLSQHRSTEVCGRCHSGHGHRAWNANTGTPFRAGDPLEKFFSMRRFENTSPERQPSFFWGDGVSRVTGREYTALVESGCYTRGEITCLSCHSMHDSDPNDQLAAGRDGDGACLQCHETYAERIEEHTHHPRGSSGARCYSCHMPNTTYGLLNLTRSHRIDSPSAAMSAQAGRPNACNLCHVDRSLAWAGDRLTEWYGQPQAAFSPDESEIPAVALWLVKGDAVQRATAAWHLGWDPALEAAEAGWQTHLLSQTLGDPYTAVRYIAERSLRKFPEFRGLDYDFSQPSTDQAEAVKIASEIAQREFAERTPKLSPVLIDRLRSQRVDPPITVLE
jgi:predicted CXXCH cytochrome family protein